MDVEIVKIIQFVFSLIGAGVVSIYVYKGVVMLLYEVHCAVLWHRNKRVPTREDLEPVKSWAVGFAMRWHDDKWYVKAPNNVLVPITERKYRKIGRKG